MMTDREMRAACLKMAVEFSRGRTTWTTSDVLATAEEFAEYVNDNGPEGGVEPPSSAPSNFTAAAGERAMKDAEALRSMFFREPTDEPVEIASPGIGHQTIPMWSATTRSLYYTDNAGVHWRRIGRW